MENNKADEGENEVDEGGVVNRENDVAPQHEVQSTEAVPELSTPTVDSLVKQICERLLITLLNPDAAAFFPKNTTGTKGEEKIVKLNNSTAREEIQEHSEPQQPVPSGSHTSVPPSSPRVITTDLIGRSRFRPIFPYAWPNKCNLTEHEEHVSSQNTRNNPISSDPNNDNNTDAHILEYEDYSTYDTDVEPYNIYYNPYMDNYCLDPNFGHNLIPVYPDNYYLSPFNDNHLSNDMNLPTYDNEFDQSTSYQPEYIPEGFNPYYPCMGNNSPIYIPDVENTNPELISMYRRSQTNFGHTSPDTNIASMRQNQFRQGRPNGVPLRYAHLYDEEEIFLLETMDLRETQHTSAGVPQVKASETGSHALDLEDYMLLANMSNVKNFICKSCSNISPPRHDHSIGILSRDEQSKTYDLQNLAKSKESSIRTKSIGILTQSLETTSVKTQTDILDVKVPFKTIIPTKFATPKPSLTSIISSGSMKTKKSVRFGTPNRIESDEESNNEAQRDSSTTGSSTGARTDWNDLMSSLESLNTTSRGALVPEQPTQASVYKDDEIPMAPRRILRRPDQPKFMTYAAVVASSHATSAETSCAKRTESFRRTSEISTSSTANAPLNSKTGQPSQPAARRSRPFVAQQRNSRPTINNPVFLELTLNQRLLPNSLKTNFEYFVNRGLHFKSIGKKIILLIFPNEIDANTVLQDQCRIGKIVTIEQASKRSQEVAARYKNIVQRNNTPKRYYKSGYYK